MDPQIQQGTNLNIYSIVVIHLIIDLIEIFAVDVFKRNIFGTLNRPIFLYSR